MLRKMCKVTDILWNLVQVGRVDMQPEKTHIDPMGSAGGQKGFNILSQLAGVNRVHFYQLLFGVRICSVRNFQIDYKLMRLLHCNGIMALYMNHI